MDDKLQILQTIANTVIDRHFTEGLSTLSSAEQTFLLVWCFGGEVDNGGLVQFFYNNMGEHALATVSALHEVGAIESARVLEEANHLFGSAGPPLDLEDRNDALSRLEENDCEQLQHLTQAYFDYDEDHLVLLWRFVQRNQSAFPTVAS